MGGLCRRNHLLNGERTGLMNDARIEDPPYFYKYRGVTSQVSLDRLLAVLTQHQLWFARPIEFNDPFDCAPAVRTTFTREGLAATAIRVADRRTRSQPEAVREAARKQLMADALASTVDQAEAQSAAKQIMAAIQTEIGVLSLSDKSDSVLMWSHYGESHTGVCLRFDTAKSRLMQEAQPVRYQEERPVIDLIGDRENTMEKALLHKASYWAYEEEWRVIRVKRPGLHRFEPEALDAIIFGAKIDPAIEARIRAAAHSGGVGATLLRTRFDEDRFRLNLETA